MTTDTALSLTEDAFLKLLADPTRLRALLLLAREGELCVCELVHALDVSQPKISRHLAQLRNASVVADRRDAVWVHYRLSEALPYWAARILTVLRDSTAERDPYRLDRQRLEAMVDRPGGRCAADTAGDDA
ncbi:metalloregulator ArsR/SmtB family transcription factor [Ectothiorhodospiraceae bacterium WFHF3C12]|nr:metalloregulator ArsR/SmtB family transcription factor [Ectothiorhodospiraceae bacterium WFHF3C12]